MMEQSLKAIINIQFILNKKKWYFDIRDRKHVILCYNPSQN